MTYQYKSPTERGGKRVKIPASLHRLLLNGKRKSVTCRYEYYIYPEIGRFEIHKFDGALAFVSFILALPLSILWFGLKMFLEEAPGELRRYFNQKKYGAFSVYTFTKRGSDEIWEKITSSAKEVNDK